MSQTMTQRLYRSRTDRMVAGVCGGMAKYFNLDPALIRLVWVLAGVFSGGTALLAYIVLAIVLPEESYRPASRTPTDGSTAVPAEQEGDPEDATTGRHEWASSASDLFGDRRRQWAALILVAVGIVLLAGNFGLLRWFNWNVYWPLVLVAIGGWLLVRRSRGAR